MINASLKNYRQSPRKVRLVANLIRGKSAKEAVSILKFTVKRASHPVLKLLESAIANANHNFKIEADNLKITKIAVNPGYVLKRQLPRSRGMANQILKRTSHVLITLSPINK